MIICIQLSTNEYNKEGQNIKYIETNDKWVIILHVVGVILM